MLRLPRPRLGDPEPRTGLWADAEPDVVGNGGGLVSVAARAGVCAVHAGDLPDRGAADGRSVLAARACGGVVRAA